MSAVFFHKVLQSIHKLIVPCHISIRQCKMASLVEQASLFPAKPDIYNGLTIETQDLSLTDEEFESTLKTSLSDWMKTGIRGVWFRVNLTKSSYIPLLVKHGFLFHHAKPTYVMLTRWLPGDEPNLLPQYPHTHIGVGGMVINEKNQVLTIQEKYQRAIGMGHWKLPGGYSNPGEDFADTAKREVFEETGIETEFVSIVAFRHNHRHIFKCSDIYLVCHLRPISENIVRSQEEIALCQWMDVETYRNHPQVTEFNKFIMNAFLDSNNLKASIGASSVQHFMKESYNKVYHVQSINDS